MTDDEGATGLDFGIRVYTTMTAFWCSIWPGVAVGFSKVYVSIHDVYEIPLFRTALILTRLALHILPEFVAVAQELHIVVVTAERARR